ncbi:MAG: protein kinase [Gammaproteobacteria bacterium]|nr:protein kinase [Gammaproteobacteria bacterium]
MQLSVSQIALLSRLLDEALSLDAAQRRLWLASHGAAHPDLADALRRALFPETSPDAAASALGIQPSRDPASTPGSTAANALQAGGRVGPYELIQALGAGGMAQVWLARRADGAFTRTVALKLPALRELRPDLAERFAHERDILASLEHPYIARFYDAGVDPNGLPYFAMEYVRGEPLIRWCDAHRLPVPERLQLLLQVLDALQFAHAHQVIHRDIKPSNILVNEAGEIRLLDFGVAKLLAPQERPSLTVVYGRALTPEYASPELARGDAVDPTTDTYSLGVVLYELLTGALPYEIRARGSADEVGQAISSAAVSAPSAQLAPDAAAARGTTQGRLRRSLRGDLDAVVMQALAKAPTERYATAAAFAEDLQRHLRGEPVHARRGRLLYRLGKRVRRHPVGWAAGAAAFLVLGILTPTLLKGTRSVPVTAAVPPDSVQVVAAVPSPPAKSIAVLPFVDMSERRDQEYFSDGLAEELISQLAHSSDLKVIARTSSFQFKGKSEDARVIGAKLGVAHLLEGSVRKADRTLRITAQLIRAADGADLWSETYDRDLTDIFKVQHEIAGQVAQALHVALAHSGENSARLGSIEAYNLVLEGNYFKARWTPPDLQRAIQLYRQAIQIRPDYALAWASLGGAYFDEQALRGTASAQDNQRILSALERATQLDPKLALPYFTRAGYDLSVSWDWKAAAANIERVRELEPGNELLPRAQGGLALTFGKVNAAVVLYQKALERDPLDARSLAYLGDALCAANRVLECLHSRLRLLQLHPEFNGVYSVLGTAQLQAGQYDAALESMRQEPEENYRLGGLALVQWALGRKADANAALRSLEDKFANTDAYAIAEVHAYRGEPDLAIGWLERAYRQRDTEMSSVLADPLLSTLHGDKRFQALLVKLGLAPEA